MTWGDVLQAAIAACMAKGPNAEVAPNELAQQIMQIVGVFRQPDVYAVTVRTVKANAELTVQLDAQSEAKGG